MSKDRVAIVSAFFDPASGYVESVVAAALARRIETHVVTSDRRISGIRGQDDLLVADEWAGVRIHRGRAHLAFRGRVVPEGVEDRLTEIDPAVVVQFSPTQLYSLPATRWVERSGIPLVYVSGENPAQRPSGRMMRIAAKGYEASVRSAIYKRCAGSATLVFGVTPGTVEALEKSSRRADVGLLNLPVDESIFTFDPQLRESERLRRGWRGHTSVFIGKFEERKHLQGIISAWDRALGGVRSNRLVMIGWNGDEYGKRVEGFAAKASGRVDLMPFLSQAEVAAVYQAADLAVFTTPTIGIQQALATGIPVAVAKAPEISHLTQRGSPAGIFLIEEAIRFDRSDGSRETQTNWAIPKEAYATISGATRSARAAAESGGLDRFVEGIMALRDRRDPR